MEATESKAPLCVRRALEFERSRKNGANADATTQTLFCTAGFLIQGYGDGVELVVYGVVGYTNRRRDSRPIAYWSARSRDFVMQAYVVINSCDQRSIQYGVIMTV